jgi:hypothetical protein
VIGLFILRLEVSVMSKMQEDFEAWHKSVVEGEPPHDKYSSGDYRNQHVQRYWLGWKASRESLVIELPKPWQTNVGAMMTPNGVKFAIASAGLKHTVQP